MGSSNIGKKKVRFTDEVRGNHIATVYEVESYKELYGGKGSKSEKDGDENENCACKCTIF